MARVVVDRSVQNGTQEDKLTLTPSQKRGITLVETPSIATIQRRRGTREESRK